VSLARSVSLVTTPLPSWRSRLSDDHPARALRRCGIEPLT
jgi:hypothetical protein